MALDLRANTAVDVLIGPFVDSTDGNTEETALTISQADVKLSKNGQTLAQKTDANAAVHDANGMYNCPLDTTDTNTEGNLVLIVHETGALFVRHEFNIMAEAAWDSLYVAKDDGFIDVNIKTVGRADTQETEANNLESACANYSATRGLSGTALPAAAADAVGGLVISDAGGLDIDTKLANTNEVTTARMGSLTDWIDGGRLDLLLDAIKVVTDNLPNSGALTDIDTGVNNIEAKLPTNYIMGSSVLTAKDDEIDAIKAKTDNLPADPADDSDIDTQLAAIAGYIDTEIAAIKAVTDNLPESGALTTLLANIAAILADTGTAGVVLTAAERNAVADAMLSRGISNVEATAGFRTLTGAIAKLVNKVAVVSTTLTVYKTNDSDAMGTQTVTLDAGAYPITVVDTN